MKREKEEKKPFQISKATLAIKLMLTSKYLTELFLHFMTESEYFKDKLEE